MNMRNAFFTGFCRGMRDFTATLSAVFNTILLTLVYFLAVGPVSIIAKLTGKKFLHAQMEEKEDSYWQDIKIRAESEDDNYKQY